ncbi:TolC family protein [Chondrinema litorale]|uniref:TolC family protein n=1 Tax=Chondrinema litorale TaxID=2994555 RepID=UPI002543E5D3|nr:TolC family protein [Chondrinema litorale]UZR95066.1 TolC family protein [Chondrinema litorale]
MKFLPAICLIVLSAFSTSVFAQKILTLQEVIEQAKLNSLSAKQAENRKENRYWQYNRYLADYHPQLSLIGDVPDFNRTISAVTLPDGTEQFVSRSLSTANIELQASQVVSATGGQVFLSSQMQRIDIFNNGGSVAYAANPLIVGFNQPIFSFNEFKWDKKIEPIRYEESVKQFNEDLERVAYQACDLYFNLLLAQISRNIATINRVNNDTIYRIAQGRYQLGKIAENELLQLELNLVNSQQQVRQANLDLETAMLDLNTYIGNPENESLTILEPVDIPQFSIELETAIKEAKANRQQYLSFKRERIEAERDVAEAKGESGLNVNLYGTFGLTQQADNVPDLYSGMKDQQRVILGFEIPIVDWGRLKASRKTAQANQDLVNSTVAQEEINFEQEIYVLVKQFEILREQLKASIIADKVAQKRYDISQQRYLVAKISITDLNIALQDKDEAKRNYLESLRDFWNSYYQIRMLTLYDFERKEKIVY